MLKMTTNIKSKAKNEKTIPYSHDQRSRVCLQYKQVFCQSVKIIGYF
jgi:hypothetical protein